MTYAIGIDFGTESGRVLIVNITNGDIVGMSVCPYKHGVINHQLHGKPLPPYYALQDSRDYMDILKTGIPSALKRAKVRKEDVVGIGIDFTSSTMMVVDQQYVPLSWKQKYKFNPHAYVKLWKHHGAIDEKNQILNAASDDLESYLGTYGFNVNSEWIIPKILELKNHAPEILRDTAYIMEAGDWLVSKLVNRNIRSNCARGFKSFWDENNGFNFEFYKKIDDCLPDIIKSKFEGNLVKVGQKAGLLTNEMSEELGLLKGTPVAAAIIDAHSSLLSVGSIRENQLTTVMGTSSCHIMLHKDQKKIPGISGSVKDAIIPNSVAYEAGQSAVGDLFYYAAMQAPKDYVKEANNNNISIYDLLEKKAHQKEVGKTGLVALDWFNGNRSLLNDSRLTALVVGQTINTNYGDMYRAYMEATAFGARMIMNTYEEFGLNVEEVFTCGGLPKKNSLLMQIYTDVLNKPIHISSTDYAPAVGVAILGALAGNAHDTIEEAIDNMKQPILKTIYPNEGNVEKYNHIFNIYKELHDYFGINNKELMYKLQKLQNM